MIRNPDQRRRPHLIHHPEKNCRKTATIHQPVCVKRKPENLGQEKRKPPRIVTLQLLRSTLASLSRLLGQEVLVNVRQNTTLGNGDMAKKLVQFLVVADSELQMTGDDTGLLVVASGVTSQLKDLSRQVLKDGSEVDGSTSTDTLGVVSLPQQTVDTSDGESETSLGRAALRRLSASSLTTFTSGRHCD